jgi:hypothetical protein
MQCSILFHERPTKTALKHCGFRDYIYNQVNLSKQSYVLNFNKQLLIMSFISGEYYGIHMNK